MDEWTNEKFFNPFGPNLLQLKINEDIRLKLLDLITLWLQSHEPVNFTGGGVDNLRNSVVDGKMGIVYEEQLEGHPGNIIHNMLCRYGEFTYNMPCDSNIETVWYGIMKSGDFQILHDHSPSQVSGAIYLKVPDNLPHPQGNINWVLNHHASNFSPSALYNNTLTHPPQPGDVFLWPGWLTHTVYPFRSKQERIMISFNGQIKRKPNG